MSRGSETVNVAKGEDARRVRGVQGVQGARGGAAPGTADGDVQN